jgi:tetratricopeptide (TPR) repeat protein
MTAEIDNLLKKCVELREAKRLDEAIISARRATSIDSESANAWYQLALAVADKDGDKAAIEYFEKTVSLSDNFSYGWYRLGKAHKSQGNTDLAIEAWERACELDGDYQWARYELIDAYKARRLDDEKDILFNHLVELDQRENLRAIDNHELAILHAQKDNHITAIPYYKRYLSTSNCVYGYTNLSLAYSSQDVSQDLDASDCCQIALEIDANFAKATRMLAPLESKLTDVRARAHRALSRTTLVSEDAWFRHYVNPFELLQLTTEVEDPDPIDIRELQRAKKLLMQEIDLEDGLVQWVPGLRIDRSRAIKVADDLSDQALTYFHWLVFQFKPLLNFLSRGDLALFLYKANEYPKDIIGWLESDPDFRVWLSALFCKQYDAVFGAAFLAREVDLVEPLLDGRRYVTENDAQSCFDTALRYCSNLLDELDAIEANTKHVKPSRRDIDRALEKQNVGKLLELLPHAFYELQAKAAETIRSISVGIYNNHGDPDLAKEVLAIATNFARRSPLLKSKLNEDSKTLDELIKDAKKDEVYLTFGDTPFRITRDTVTHGEKIIRCVDVESIRWGIEVTNSSGRQTYEFSINVIGKRSESIKVFWRESSNLEKQEALFRKCANALCSYVVPHVIEHVKTKLKAGYTIRIGGIPVSRAGVTLTAEGWFTNSEELCAWRSVSSNVSNGSVNVRSSTNSKARASLDLGEVDNAWVLHFIIQQGLLQ